MAIKVTVNSVPTIRVSVNDQTRETIRTVGVGVGALASTLSGLTDVDTTGKVNNATLVYDSSSNKYIVKILPILDGGEF